MSEEQIRLEAMKIVWAWVGQTDRQPEPPRILFAYADSIIKYVKAKGEDA